MDKVKRFLHHLISGFLIGLGNVVPGVSGGTIALITGIYEDLVECIANIRKHFGKSMKMLIPLFLGVGIAFLSMSYVVTYCLEHFLFPTIMLFFGAVVGGLPMLFKKVNGTKFKPVMLIPCIVAFALVMGTSFLQEGGNIDLSSLNIGIIIALFIMGAVAAGAMVVPGISGSALLMTFGFYNPIMNEVKNLTSGDDKLHSLLIICVVAVGILCGVFGIAKFIGKMLKDYEVMTYWAIIGFVIASALVIVIQNFFIGGISANLGGTSVIQYIVGVLICAGAFAVTYKWGD